MSMSGRWKARCVDGYQPTVFALIPGESMPRRLDAYELEAVPRLSSIVSTIDDCYA